MFDTITFRYLEILKLVKFSFSAVLSSDLKVANIKQNGLKLFVEECQPYFSRVVGYPSVDAVAPPWSAACSKSPASRPCQHRNWKPEQLFWNNLELIHASGHHLLLVDWGKTEICSQSVVPKEGSRLLTGIREGPLFSIFAYFWRLLFDLNNSESSSLGKKSFFVVELEGPQTLQYMMYQMRRPCDLETMSNCQICREYATHHFLSGTYNCVTMT